MIEWPRETSPGRSIVIAGSEATWQSRSVERRPHNRTAATSKPNDPISIVEPGATRINVDQDPVGSSASYLVQCCLKGKSIAEDARLTAEPSDAEINLFGPGIWIVRLQACNADGCSGLAISYTPVITAHYAPTQRMEDRQATLLHIPIPVDSPRPPLKVASVML